MKRNDLITILLVDTHKLIREAWTSILNSDERFLVVGETGNAGEAYRIVREKSPRIVLADVIMPPHKDFEITRKIAGLSSATKVIGVSHYTSIACAEKVMQWGAMGYVTMNSSGDELIAAIIEVSKGYKFICREIEDLLAARPFITEFEIDQVLKLTKTELEVIDAVRKGLSSAEIAVRMQIGPATVRKHRYNILKKLKLKNTAALVGYANRLRI